MALSNKQPRRTLTTHEAAAMLSVDPTTIINWAKEGRYSVSRTPGGHRRVNRREFEVFAASLGMPLQDAPASAVRQKRGRLDTSALTTHQVANLVEVNPSTVLNWVKAGKLRTSKTPGGHRRIHGNDLRRFLETTKLEVPSVLKRLNGLADNVLWVEPDGRVRTRHERAVKRLNADGDSSAALTFCRTNVEALIQLNPHRSGWLVLNGDELEPNAIVLAEQVLKQTDGRMAVGIVGRFVGASVRKRALERGIAFCEERSVDVVPLLCG